LPNTRSRIFFGSLIEYATLHVPEKAIEAYKSKEPWNGFGKIIAIEGGGESDEKQCEKPSIGYKNGKLSFNCATEGVEYQYTISDSDVKSGTGSEIDLTVTYTITVYATKTGYQNSESTTATLCWIDQEPKKEGITDGISQVRANAVLIQNNDGIMAVSGVDKGQRVSVYQLDGTLITSDISIDGSVLLTNIPQGSLVIVKIGNKSIKVFNK